MADAESVGLSLGDGQSTLKQKAESAGLGTTVEADWDGEPLRTIVYPEGRSTRSISYTEERARTVTNVHPGIARFSPDLDGIIFTDSGDVDGQGTGTVSPYAGQHSRIENLDEHSGDTADEPGESGRFGWQKLSNDWRLRVTRPPLAIEVSPSSDRFRSIRGIPPNYAHPTFEDNGIGGELQYRNTGGGRTSDSFFFDLDARYRVNLELVEGPHVGIHPVMTKVSAPPIFPTNRYHSQPAALYRYGRSATAPPLLSYLAFYQVLEFFFPIYTQDEIIRRARQILTSPQFDPSDQVALANLVKAIKPNSRGFISEREQMRTTLRRCFDIGPPERPSR